MIKWKKLFGSKTYWLGQLQDDLFAEVEAYLKDNKLTREDFANKIGKSKGYVSQILNGRFDHKLSKMVEICLSVDKVPVVIYVDKNRYAKAAALQSPPYGLCR